MSQFFFDGSSRMRKMTLARDHHRSRNGIIEDAQRLRAQREEETRRFRAAQRLQRVVRSWLARQCMMQQAMQRISRTLSDMQMAVATHRGTASDEDLDGCPFSGSAEAAKTKVITILEAACWAYHYMLTHMSSVPVHCFVEAPLANEEEEEAAAAAAGMPIVFKSLEERRRYQKDTVIKYGNRLFAAVSYLSGWTEQTSSQVLKWPSIVAGVSSATLGLLLRVLLHQIGRTDASSDSYGAAIARIIVDDVIQRDQQGSTTASRGAPLISKYGDEEQTGAASSPSLPSSVVAQTLCMGMEYIVDDGAEQHTASLAGVAAMLQPLLRALSPAVISTASATPLAAVMWRCLCAPVREAECQRLASNPLAVSCGMDDADCSSAEYCSTAAASQNESSSPSVESPAAREAASDALASGAEVCFQLLVEESYRRIVEENCITKGSDINGIDGGKLRARVLDRLVRLMPLAQRLVTATASSTPSILTSDSATAMTKATATSQLCLKKYLLCLSSLSERLCRESFFIEGILADHYAHNTSGRGTVVAAVSHLTKQSPSIPTTTSSSAMLTTAPVRSVTAGLKTNKSDQKSGYQHAASYLFSSEGGLLLLQLLSAHDGRSEPPPQKSHKVAATAASSSASASVTQDAGQSSRLPASGAAASTGSRGGAAAAEMWPSSTSMQQSSLEILCNVFAWPLFTFSKPNYHRYQQETLALHAKLVRTPQLLCRLWSLFWRNSEGLRSVLPPGESLLAICGPIGTHSFAGGGLAIPRLQVWATHPSHPHAFYDPYPSLSVFFFTLLAYYANVVDFAEELRQAAAAVLNLHECHALILALKEVVHRAHLYGVVPGTNSEAVAYTAGLLLSRLHVVSEADPFVQNPAMWVSLNDATSDAVLMTLGSSWDEASASVEAEEAAEEDEDNYYDIPAGVPLPSGTSGSLAPTPALSLSMCLPGDEARFRGSCGWNSKTRYTKLLLHAPFLVPFSTRAALLCSLLLMNEQHRWTPPQAILTVHRGRVFVDAFDLFHDDPASGNMHHVRFVEEGGELEQGYGRGVYREFLVSLCKEGFAVEHGLFQQTPEGSVYPNSFSFLATNDPQHLQKIRFLGAMVGRALSDGVLQEVSFALHFRNAILGRRNTLSNLKRFDAQLYHQLMSLTRMSDDELKAMELNFVYTVHGLGVTSEVELIPGGAHMDVTSRNCLFYVHLIADFKLNREAAEQTGAFCAGLRTIFHQNWLRLFDSNEVGKLFGGDEAGQIDLADWKENTVYDRPEDVNAVPVRLFWDVVTSLTSIQQSQLLKFVTSMTRPPLLGFRFLAPPFKVQLLSLNVSGPDRLPSAATCFSTLKLPPYQDYATARAKIIAAIEETNTFEFS